MQDWRVGDVIGERFEVRGQLGHGSFAEVLAVQERRADGVQADQAPLPLKALKLLHRGGPGFEREIAAARRAGGHARLLVAEQALQLGELPALVLPCSRGQLLADWLQLHQPNPACTLPLLGSLAGLTATLHGLGVAHDDLGFGNVMVVETAGVEGDSGWAAELIDFGSSVCCDGPMAAPRERPNAFYGQRLQEAGFEAVCADDVRALAVLTMLTLTRRHPFCDDWQRLLDGSWTGPDPFAGAARACGLGGPLADILAAALGPAAGRPDAAQLGAHLAAASPCD